MLRLLAFGAVLCAPAAAFAEPVTRTVTFDGPRYQGTRTITRDREAGTVTRDARVTRRSDGAVATRHVELQRTESGVTGSGTVTRFNGETRSFQISRTGHRPVRPRLHRPRRGR